VNAPCLKGLGFYRLCEAISFHSQNVDCRIEIFINIYKPHSEQLCTLSDRSFLTIPA
jgi:hypothetical protein